MGILYSILIGGIAGFLADLVFKRFSFSLIVQILLGFVGGMLFGRGGSMIDQILTAFVGAVIVLGIAALIKGRNTTV